MPNFILPIVVPVVIAIAIAVIFASGYIKAPPNVAYIISGCRKKPRVLVGKAGIRIPFLERIDKLIVKQVSVDIKTNGYIPTKDFIGVKVDAVAKIQMNITDPDGCERATKNFLNMSEADIITALSDSLQGNMREIIGTIPLKDICTDKETFGNQLQTKAQKDMDALGIQILSCNIQNVEDENGLINALGQDNMSQIQKEASIAKANADRDVAIARAKAAQDANAAQVESDTVIAARQNELEIKKAELKQESDAKKAIADAAYKIMEQEQRKEIEIATENANLAKQERQVEVMQKQVEIEEKTLDAEVRKKAEAEKFARQQKADAERYERERRAEADLFEREKVAAAKKVEADAALYAKEMEAKGICSVGEAEANAIKAKGLAEAEALEKKAEAMKKYGEAAILEMVVEKLPEMASAIAMPLQSIDKVTIIDGGNGNSGVENMSSYVPTALVKTMESMKEMTGFDIVDVLKSSTIQAKTTRNVNIKGLEKSDVDSEVVGAIVKDVIEEEVN